MSLTTYLKVNNEDMPKPEDSVLFNDPSGFPDISLPSSAFPDLSPPKQPKMVS